MYATNLCQLGDRIAGLSMSEAKQLSRYLREAYGIKSPAEPQPDQKTEVPKTSFDVVLTSYGDKKIRVIKAVHTVTGLELKESKRIVESAPICIAEAMDRLEAEEWKGVIKEAGGIVDLR